MKDEFKIKMHNVEVMIHNWGMMVEIDGEEFTLTPKNITTFNTYSVAVFERDTDKTLWQVVMSEDDDPEDELNFYRLDNA